MKWVLIQRSITTAFGFLALFASCIVSGEELYFVHTDHLGTPQVVTDASQATVWEGRQTPFGETEIITNQIEMNVRFPGQYYDQESGLSYNYFRDYDSGLGRYVQSDPIGLDGGSNTYGYVYQNPFIYSDPTGEVGQLILAGAVILITTNAANAPTSQMESDALQDATALGVLGASIDNFPGCKIGSSIKNGIKESVTKGPISVDDALGKAADFMKDGVPIRSVDGKTGVQFIQEFTENGQKITKRAGFDLNPNSSHVKQLGPHLNLQTQINGKIQKKGPLADPHIPIDPKSIRPGDY